MIKRFFDLLVSFACLVLASPALFFFMILVWLQDGHSPFYSAPRIGKEGKVFKMLKMRSMVVNADRSGVDSTAANDQRITPVGRFIRRYKIDELTQLWNVLKGDISLVGPRPNVKSDVDLYTEAENRLLSVKPGITDIASIVFSDEGEILKDSDDPDLKYNQVIRPWKGRLGLLYVEKRNLALDLQLIFLTFIALFSRNVALRGIQGLLTKLGADAHLKQIARREETLSPYPPPGAAEIIQSR